MKTKLLVMPNFTTFKRGYNEDGTYMLIHPQFYLENNNALFGHLCSNLSFAFYDLQYPNRKDFLNEIFGEENWEFEFYDFENERQFTEDMKNFENPIIDCQKIVDLFGKYKKEEKRL